MEKSIQITLIIAVALVIVVSIGGYLFYQIIPHYQDTSKTITVNGVSNIKVTPDLVSIYFTVETNGSTAKEAKDANSRIVSDLTTALIKQGFNKEDIQTESLSIYEDIRWSSNSQKSYGWKANHQIKITMNTSSSSKIGEVIDSGVDSGAILNWINFELSTTKQNEYKAQALKEAGQDAKTKADAIAQGLDKKLGEVISISTSEWRYNPWNVYTSSVGGMAEDAVMAKQVATNIQPSNEDVSGYVTVTYKIK